MKKKYSASRADPASSLTLWRLAQLICGPVTHLLFGLLIAWSLLQPIDSTEVFQGSALPQNLGWILLSLLVSLLGLLDRSFLRVRRMELAILGILAAWMFVVSLRAGWYCNPRTGWHGFWHIVGLICFYYSARCLLSCPNLRGMTVLILMAAGAVLAIFGLYQVGIEFPAVRANYAQDPEALLQQFGWDAPMGSAQRLRFEARLNSPEPFATFALTNSLAVFISGALVLAWGAMTHTLIHPRQQSIATLRSAKDRTNETPIEAKLKRIKRRSNKVGDSAWFWSRTVLVVLSFLIGILWLLTRSRVAYLSLLVAGVAWALHQFRQVRSNSRQAPSKSGLDLQDHSDTQKQPRRRTGRWWLGSMISAGLLALAWLWFYDRSVFTEAVRSVSFRGEYWTATAALIADHWLWGIGLGNFQSYYPRYMLATASETIADPHNWILDLVVNCSLPFSLLVFAGLLRNLLPWRPSILPDPSDRPITHENGNRSNTLWLSVGAACGCLAVGCGMWLFGFNLPLLLVALPTAITLAMPAWPAVREFVARDVFFVRWAALTMLFCLLVSGSWQAAGIAIPFLCLLSCSIGDSWKPNAMAYGESDGRIPNATSEAASRTKGLALVALFFVLLVSFVLQGWNPVLSSESVGLSQQPSLTGQLEAVKRARQLDPLESKWDRFLVSLLTQRAIQSSDGEVFGERSREAVKELQAWTAREPISFLTWQTAGQNALDLASRAQKLGVSSTEFLALATDCFKKSAQAYPTSVQLRVQLALAHLLREDQASAQFELEKADELDNITPHMDKKLPQQIIWIPQLEGVPESLRQTNGAWSPAEPVVNWMRTQL